MLSAQDNDLLCRVGPGTPMGDMMRQYWLPAVTSEELPAPDCPPMRVRLLGEDLIAFRTTSGDVGVIQNACLRDEGIVPAGVDNPEIYAQRSGGVILPRTADWWEATQDLRRAFVDRPEMASMAALGNA